MPSLTDQTFTPHLILSPVRIWPARLTYTISLHFTLSPSESKIHRYMWTSGCRSRLCADWTLPVYPAPLVCDNKNYS